MSLEHCLSAKSRARHSISLDDKSDSGLSLDKLDIDVPKQSFIRQNSLGSVDSFHDDVVQMDGWVWKKAALNWKRYFARVISKGSIHILRIYKDSEIVPYQLELILSNQVYVQPESGKKHAIRLLNGRQELVIAVDGKEELEDWLRCFVRLAGVRMDRRNSDEAIDVKTVNECDIQYELQDARMKIRQMEELQLQLEALKVEKEAFERERGRLQEELIQAKILNQPAKHEDEFLTDKLSQIEEAMRINQQCFRTETAGIISKLDQISRRSGDLQAHELSSKLQQVHNSLSGEVVANIMPLKAILKEMQASLGGYGNSALETFKPSFDAIGNSIQKITDFLARNADLQNASEREFHQKLDQIAAIVKDVKAAKAERQPHNHISPPTLTKKDVEVVLDTRIETLKKLIGDLSKSLPVQKDDSFIQSKLKAIQDALQVLQKPDERVDNISNEVSNITSIVTGLKTDIKATALESTIQTNHEELKEQFAAVKTQFKPINDSLMEISHKLSSDLSERRSSSPRKTHERLQEERIHDIQMSMFSVKDKLSELTRAVSQLNTERVSDSSVEALSLSVLQNLQSDCDAIMKLFKGINENSDMLPAISKKLDVSELANKQTLQAIESKLEELRFHSFAEDIKAIVEKQSNEKLHERVEEISNLLESSFQGLAEELEAMQEGLSTELKAYSTSLTSLMQDREMLMQENQRLQSLSSSATSTNSVSVEDLNKTQLQVAMSENQLEMIRKIEHELVQDIAAKQEAFKLVQADLNDKRKELDTVKQEEQTLRQQVQQLKQEKAMIEIEVQGQLGLLKALKESNETIKTEFENNQKLQQENHELKLGTLKHEVAQLKAERTQLMSHLTALGGEQKHARKLSF